MMNSIQIDIQGVERFIQKEKIILFKDKTYQCFKKFVNKTVQYKKYLGWIDYPEKISEKEIKRLEDAAHFFRTQLEVIVVIGIGGSYLGARMINEALQESFLISKNKSPKIVYAGHNISQDYLFELTEFLKNKSFGICVISKSGTTLESAISFRLLRNLLEKKIGKKNASKFIIAVTDEKKGVLKTFSDKYNYQTFVIPNDIGGRYSVLTPAGLLPVALAGNNIRQLLNGAKDMKKIFTANGFDENIACQYAAIRNILYRQRKYIEILVVYHPKLFYLTEWWKQLFAESEGKKNKGIFTASCMFTTDLHSLGQYIQEGKRNIFETSILIKKSEHKLLIPNEMEDLDKLNYLGGKNIEYINKIAAIATQKAHIDGGVPNLQITLPKLNEYYLGQLIYFFLLSCAISGKLLGVNPFNQPGVEAYKKNMFQLLYK